MFILFGKRGELARSLAYADDITEERDKLSFVCSCAVDAVKTGGSVLIPIDRLGIVLQLLEEISASLDTLNLKVFSLLRSPNIIYTLVIHYMWCRWYVVT